MLREEFLELGGQLGGQGLVVGEHQGGALDALDDVGDRERLAGAGYAEQGLGAVAGVDALNELLNGLGLTAGRLEVGADLEARAGAALGKGGHDPSILGRGSGLRTSGTHARQTRSTRVARHGGGAEFGTATPKQTRGSRR